MVGAADSWQLSTLATSDQRAAVWFALTAAVGQCGFDSLLLAAFLGELIKDGGNIINGDCRRMTEAFFVLWLWAARRRDEGGGNNEVLETLQWDARRRIWRTT